MKATKWQKEAAAALLRDAVAAIQKYGWVKGWSGSEDCGFCAIGALYYAAQHRGTAPYLLARKTMVSVIGGCIAHFNDRPRRTKPDGVLRAMRKAARQLEGGS